jgi:hypothetical protein
MSPSCAANLFSISSCATCLIDLYVAVGDGEDDGVAVLVGVEVGETDGVGVGVGVAFTAILTPLFHTSFLPDFMQVYLVVPTTAVEPAFVQVVPGFTAALEMPAPIATKIAIPRTNLSERFI